MKAIIQFQTEYGEFPTVGTNEQFVVNLKTMRGTYNRAKKIQEIKKRPFRIISFDHDKAGRLVVLHDDIKHNLFNSIALTQHLFA